MSGRYFDQPSSSPSRSASSSGGSYTDRYRVDNEYPSDLVTASGFGDFESSGSGSLALGSGAVRSSRKNVPTAKLLESLIERACSPVLHEPNLALNLEIADIINQKKGSCPRIAAGLIVKLINSKDPHVAILALSVLDICVKNCGYPFHLQISRKDFLNELVRRFPEKPPIAYTRVQSLILQAIQEWWETICCTSKYKDDLGYIRDMHRLLTRKGYIFPEISPSEAAVLNPAENLQSASELEQEERDAQEAKLQELIRRGTPADLQEANRLMKVMAGFQGDKKSDYRAKVAEEVDKLRRKAELLDEMLSNTTPGADLPEDDVFSDIVSSLKTSVPKLKSLAQEESDDEEAVAKLLALNDYTHSLLEKYHFLKQKDIQKANSVHIARPSNVQITKGQSAPPEKSISLIDFDDEPAPQGSSASATPQPASNSLDLLSELGGLSLGGNTSPNPFGPKSNQDILAAFGSPSTLPGSQQQPSSGNGSLDLLRGLSSPKPESPASPSNSDLNEWNFASAAPPSSVPSFTLVDDNVLAVAGTVARTAERLHIVLNFSNKAATPISGLNIQLAVKRDLHIQVHPLSATVLDARATNGVTQTTYVENAGAYPYALKLRWIVTYDLGGETVRRDGVASLPEA